MTFQVAKSTESILRMLDAGLKSFCNLLFCIRCAIICEIGTSGSAS